MKPFIFISCGQYLQKEKELGITVKQLVELNTPFDGYFAEDQNSVNGLVANILERLYGCMGFISIMHPRGIVADDKGQQTVRASVWIEQEIAMIALIQQLVRNDKNDLKIAAYAHKSIKLEGIRTLLHLNPMPFEHDLEILEDLQKKLPNWQLDQGNAMEVMKQQRYAEEMQRLKKTPEHIETLRILTVDGSANDRYVLGRLQQKQLASSWASVLEGLSNSSPFIQPVQGQPERIQPSDRRFEIKPEVRKFLEDYFAKF
jgi:hypothetical protein